MATAGKDFERQEIFLRPMCLIQTETDGTLYFVDDVVKQIQRIDAPLVVVAVAGLYRTGKSYLMNRLAGQSNGFPLGSTIQSKTKGIWVWCRKHPVLKNAVLVLLDTEGLGDVAKGDQGHDNRIFTLAVLLCNVLVYNMMTVFNQDAVEKLTFISELSKNIRFKNRTSNRKEEDQLELILPTFILCLRDFTLDLEIDGKEISADEYLEDSLQLKMGKGPDIERYNRPRESIRKYFPVRKCFTFDVPGNRTIMKQLDKLSLEDLSETFVEETQKFLHYVYERKPKALLHSKPVTGAMFVSLVRTYVVTIKDGAVPDVDDAIMVVANMENERMASIAVETFRQDIKEIKLPILQADEFDKVRQIVQNKSLAHFRAEAVFNSEKYEIRAIAEMDKLWVEIKDKNLEQVKKYCKFKLKEVYDEIVGVKMTREEYTKAGGHMEYKVDIGTFKTAYKKNLKGTDEYMAQNVLNSFLEEEAEKETIILMSDQKLTKEDRERETKRMLQEHKEAEHRQQQMFENRMLEEKKRTEEYMNQLAKEREEYRRLEQEKLEQLTEQWNAQRELANTQMKTMMEVNQQLRLDQQKQMDILETNMKKTESLTLSLFQDSKNKMEQMIESNNNNFVAMNKLLAKKDEDIANERKRAQDAEVNRKKELDAIAKQLSDKHDKEKQELMNKMDQLGQQNQAQRVANQKIIEDLQKRANQSWWARLRGKKP